MYPRLFYIKVDKIFMPLPGVLTSSTRVLQRRAFNQSDLVALEALPGYPHIAVKDC